MAHFLFLLVLPLSYFPRISALGQVRTLQRGLPKIRARLLITFDDQWGEETVNGHLPIPELRAEVIAGLPS